MRTLRQEARWALELSGLAPLYDYAAARLGALWTRRPWSRTVDNGTGSEPREGAREM